MKLKVMDCFSGIGGFTIGLEAAGMQTIAFCEIEDFPRKVLAKHWPDVPIARDIRKLSYNRKTKELIYDGEVIYVGSIDVVCGGFPCQDLSVAGKQEGIAAERSGLWSELCRIISEIRPKYAIVENVTALISGDSGRWFGRVLGDLAEIGYDCEWHCISASELGAHHHRDRIWIICHPQHSGQLATEIGESDQARNGSHQEGTKPAGESQGSSDTKNMANTNCECEPISINESEHKRSEEIAPERTESSGSGSSRCDVANTIGDGLQGLGEERGIEGSIRLCGRKGWNEIKAISKAGSGWDVEPELGRVANGIPDRAHRLKGLGNAVVPQIPELIGRSIMEIERHNL